MNQNTKRPRITRGHKPCFSTASCLHYSAVTLNDRCNQWINRLEEKFNSVMKLFYRSIPKKQFLKQKFSEKKAKILNFLKQHGIIVSVASEEISVEYDEIPNRKHIVGFLGNVYMDNFFNVIENTLPSVEVQLM